MEKRKLEKLGIETSLLGFGCMRFPTNAEGKIDEDYKVKWGFEDQKLYEYAKDPDVGPIAGWPPHESIEDSLHIIKTVFSKKETYAIVKDDIPIGCAGLLFHPDTNHWWGEGAVELGYWIAEEYWGNGYASESSEKLIASIILTFIIVFASFLRSAMQALE